MKSRVLTRALLREIFLSFISFLFVTGVYAQTRVDIFSMPAPGGKWISAEARWEGNTGPNPWTLTPRLGLKDEVFPFYPNADFPQYTRSNPPPWAYQTGNNYGTYIDDDTCKVRVKYDKYYISEYVQGYLEYLPKGYGAIGNNKTYPLIIYFPGCGEMGGGRLRLIPPEGSRTYPVPDYTEGLGKLLARLPNQNNVEVKNDVFNALPRELLMNGDYFSEIPLKTPGQVYPASGGATEGVIVMACIMSGRKDICGKYMPPSIFDIEKAIACAVRNYRIDISRIYVTGMSAGGGVSYMAPAILPETARKLAAIIPVAAVDNIWANRELSGSDVFPRNIINSGVSVLAISNSRDNTGSVIQNNQGSVNWLRAEPGYRPGQVETSFFTYPSNDPINTQTTPNMHNAWSWAYRSRNSPSYNFDPVTLIATKLDEPRRFYDVYTDPVSGEKYTTYEWMLTRRNLLLLPANLISFTAARVNQGVQVNWSTAQEINASHFILERSADGVRFEKLVEKPSAGNSNTKREYAHLDTELPASQYVYYRLVQVDRDGKSNISGVRKVYIGNTGFEVKIYPSVATNNVTLEIQGLVSEALTVRVIDVAGRPLMQQVIAPRQNRATIDVSRLSKGMYMVQTTGVSVNVVSKFIKQ